MLGYKGAWGTQTPPYTSIFRFQDFNPGKYNNIISILWARNVKNNLGWVDTGAKKTF